MSQSLTALQLRAAGYTYQEIADKAGYSTAATARVAVTRALERTFREPTKDLREIEARRLDALQAAVWDAATNGSVHAIDRVLKIIDARARLFGLYAPTKVDHKVDVDSAQAQALIDVLNQVLNAVGLTPQQRVIAGEVVPRALRAVSEGEPEHTL